ncbi:MAG: ribulose-phosphate 3-epimerase [Thermoguttaceae bacterium]
MAAEELVSALRAGAPLIGPSLLAFDCARLADEVRRLEEAGVRILHLDIMDGHFVPNISFGIPIVEAVRRVTRLPLDVHLMISEPARYIEAFRRAGADLITIHIEAAPEPGPLLRQIRKLGALAGISLNPPTPTAAVEDFLEDCDLVLVMSVMPGFAGQEFEPVGLEKLRRLRAIARPELLLSIDGGVDAGNIGLCAQSGADLLVMGSALNREKDYRRAITDWTGRARSQRKEFGVRS